ncbi:MAG: hypothetical protein PHQ12_05820 [Chthoniobacteraceae bacterium]|nr:hypothetical protein [Chthoniobacteraceae bacterium]
MRSSLFLPLVLGAVLCLQGVAWGEPKSEDPVQAQAKAQAEGQKLRERQRRERQRKDEERRKQPPDPRIEQILHPDTERSFDLSKEKHFGAKGYDSRSNKVMELKSPVLPQKFKAKEYMTGSFHNEKSFWMGDFKYSVGGANTTPRSLYLAPEKTYQTKAAPVKDAAGLKKYTDANTMLPTRDYRGRERQKFEHELTPEQAANNGFRGELMEMKSIEDVRTLLNKSK